MIYRIFVLLFSMSCLLTAEELSLSQAISKALKNNYDIHITKSDEKIAELNNSWGNAGRLPSLAVNLSALERWSEENRSDSELRTLNGTLTLNWILFDGFAIYIRKSRFEELERLSEGNTAIVIENTLEAVILAYYNSLLQAEKVKVLEEVMSLSRDRNQYEEERHRLGAQTRYELLQAQNAYLEDKGRYLQQRTVYRNSMRDLNFLMGIRKDIKYEFTEAFEIEGHDYDIDALLQKMLFDNRTLKNQYINQSLLEKQVALQKSEWWPGLSLGAGYEKSRNSVAYTGSDPTTYDQNNAYATLTLSWSLFNGGNRKRAIEIAQLNRQAGEVSLESMKHSLTNRLYTLIENYRVRTELLEVAVESLQAADLNLEISQEKFRNGAINSFNFRDVQMIYLNAAVSHLNAVYSLIEADHALLKLTGGIIQAYSR
ncbi:TolC family protein [candidate division KSB1 bacterium]|nr:TolC family protein [candidate division KSB1 bacterium]